MKHLVACVLFDLCLMAKLIKVLFSSLKRLGALGLWPFRACTGHRVYLKRIS